MEMFNEMLTTLRSDIKEKKQKIQRLLTITGLITLLVVVVSVGTTVTLLKTNAGTKINDLGFGQAKIEVNENFDGWTHKEVRLKVPTTEEFSEQVPGAARVMFVPYIIDGTGNYISCELDKLAKPVSGKMKIGDVILELAADWEDHWFYENGYFYYKKVLYPTAAGNANKTPVLLQKVSLTDEGQDAYGDANINIEVLSDILQAEGGASHEWNVNIDLKTGVVSKA